MLDKFVSIICAVILNPYRYFSEDMPKDNSLKYPLIFAAAVFSISFIIQSLSALSLDLLSAPEIFFVLLIILAPIFTIIFMYFTAFLFHAVIFFFVPQRSGFKQTLKVLSYSNAASVFLLIPFAGIFLYKIFELRAIFFGLSAVHKVSALKLFLIFIMIGFLYFIVFLSLFMGLALESFMGAIYPSIFMRSS